MAGGEIEQAAGGVGRPVVALPVAQAGDLAADVGPGGDVVMGQRRRIRLAGELPVAGQERGGGLGGAEPFEVHGQEGDIGENVDVAEAVVELDAVEDAGAVVEAEDVLGLEVAVPVPDRSEGDPLVEQRLPARQVAADEVLDPVGESGVEDRAGEGVHLGEAGVPHGGDGVAPAGGGDLLRRLGRGVEDGDAPGNLGHGLVDGVPVLHEPGQPPFGRHAAHDYQVVAGHAVLADDVGHAEVDVGGQAPVELHLPVAGLLPGRPVGEVEEPERHRLLELVDAFADRDEDRNVGLGDRDRH